MICLSSHIIHEKSIEPFLKRNETDVTNNYLEFLHKLVKIFQKAYSMRE